MKFLGVISSLKQYKKDVIVHVKGKDGITRPIRKVHYSKPCLDCGCDMEIDYYNKGKRVLINGYFATKGKIIRWRCGTCDYCEREESEREAMIREGEID